ncbi:MAG: hypothetical protein P0S96_06890 [Simkaniaceae bacterium]|nr:hypothetical protein [Candidatus Sacchlamyda saccharinae]
MSSVIATAPLLHAGKAPTPGIGSWVKNLLFGRVFANWKDSIIVAGVVFWVAKAALSFFTGSWLMAMAEFFTGGFLAMMRKDYRQFTDLHAATGAYRGENHEFRLSNLALRQNIQNLGKEVGLLTNERKRFAHQNDLFAKRNRVYRTQIGVMKDTLRRAIRVIDDANARGRRGIDEANARVRASNRVSSQILKTALEAFEEKERALTAIAADLDARNEVAIQQWHQLAGQVSRMNIHGVKALTEAKDELTKVLGDIRAERTTKADLQREVRHLTKVRDDLQRVVSDLEGAARKVNLAADRNLVASGKEFVSNVMSGNSSGANAFVVGLAIAAVAYAKGNGPNIAGLDNFAST